MTRRCLLTVAALIALPASASTPDAWNTHYRDAVARCLAASKLVKPRTDSHLMLFSDSVGTALLVRGKAKGKRDEQRMLCIVRRGEAGGVEIQPVDDGVDPHSLPR